VLSQHAHVPANAHPHHTGNQALHKHAACLLASLHGCHKQQIASSTYKESSNTAKTVGSINGSGAAAPTAEWAPALQKL
jgi:hypothetical protein